jgi:hypothetical protein
VIHDRQCKPDQLVEIDLQVFHKHEDRLSVTLHSAIVTSYLVGLSPTHMSWICALIFIVCVCGSPLSLTLKLFPVPEHGVVVLENEAGPVEGGVYSMQRGGMVIVPLPNNKGSVFVMRITSHTYQYPVVKVSMPQQPNGPIVLLELLGNKKKLIPVSGMQHTFVINATARESLYLERIPFSWSSFASNPMVMLGLVTIGMMAAMQLLMNGIDLEDIKREMRGEKPKAPTTAIAASQTKQIKGGKKKEAKVN